jgi:sulfonate transport system substrate-binding protein
MTTPEGTRMTRSPKTITTWLASMLVAVVCLAALSACGSDGSDEATGSTGASGTPTTSASPTEGVTVHVGVLQGVTLAAVAQHIGSIDKRLAEEGASASYEGPFPAMVPAVEALNAGDVDITYGSISAAIGSLAGNSDFKIFAVEPAQPDNEGIIAAKGSGIESAEDLKGKRIAVNKAGTGEYLAMLALDQAGLTADDAELVYLLPADAAGAFGSGQVDAWATWSAFTGLAQDKLGGTLVVSGGELGSKNDTPYIVSTEFAEQYPTLVAAVYRGLQDAARWIKENPAEAEKLYAEAGLPKSVAAAQVRASEELEPIDGALVDRFNEVARYVAEKGVVPAEVDLTDRTIDVTQLGG